MHIQFSNLFRYLVTAALVASVSVADARAQDNFQGTWRKGGGRGMNDFILGLDLPYKPEAQNSASDNLELFKAGRSKASPHLTCRPTGVQGVTATKEAMLLLQTPQEIVMIFQEDREVRHIYMNEEHPKNLTHTYSGHSVGRWDGKTLVVDTVGYNGRGQLDEMGNPHSDQLHVVERWTRSDDGRTLNVEFTFEDPGNYVASFTKVRRFVRAPGIRIADYDCGENPRSDDFDNLTFKDERFRPTCVRPVENGIAGDKVVCTPEQASQAKPK